MKEPSNYEFNGDEEELRRELSYMREEYQLQEADEWYEEWRMEND
jgi:hypothetical protein